MLTLLYAYMIVVALLSLASFVAYGLDKRQAILGGRRISERNLHLLAFLGGWPGSMMGQRFFRHKTRKLSFLIVFWTVVTLHLGIVGTVGYLLATSGQV